MELEQQRGAIERRGYGLAAISYDSTAILKTFAERRGITIPLLSDEGSAVIRRFGLQSPEHTQGDFAYGVPHPGTYVVDAKGVIRERFFGETYVERRTASSFLLRAGDPPGTVFGEHAAAGVTVRAGASNAAAFPGQRLTLVYEFELGEGRRLCSAGDTGCRPPASSLHLGSFGTVDPLSAPSTTANGTLRIFQDVMLKDRRSLAEPLKQPDPRLPISGALDFQVCRAGTCEAPASLPLRFELRLLPPDGERSPEPLRHRSSKPGGAN